MMRDEFAELEFPLNWTIWDMSDFFGHRTTSWALCLKIFENSSESFDQSIQIKFHHMNCKLIAVAINESEKKPKKEQTTAKLMNLWLFIHLSLFLIDVHNMVMVAEQKISWPLFSTEIYLISAIFFLLIFAYKKCSIIMIIGAALMSSLECRSKDCEKLHKRHSQTIY